MRLFLKRCLNINHLNISNHDYFNDKMLKTFIKVKDSWVYYLYSLDNARSEMFGKRFSAYTVDSASNEVLTTYSLDSASNEVLTTYTV